MPNYVRNVLRMSGIAKEPLFKQYDDGLSFDFNTLIPMPEELNVVSGSVTTDSIMALVYKVLPVIGSWIDTTHARDTLINHMKSRLGDDEAEINVKAENGLKYASNIVKHGCATWYEWCWEKWGTKWNAMSTYIADDNEIQFETAWNDPSPVIAALAAKYPERRIEHWWADEDVGNNTGYRMWENGILSELLYEDCSQEAFENYGYCWDEDVEDGDILHRGEDGLIDFVDN